MSTVASFLATIAVAQEADEYFGSLKFNDEDTTEIAMLLYGSRNREQEKPEFSKNGIEIDFILEYGPLGRRYLTVYVVDDVVFLPLFDLFNLFKINIQYSSSQRVASGYYIDVQTRYAIDFLTKSIQVGDRTGTFTDDDIRVGNNGFYLNPRIFAEMFDLHFDVEPSRLRLSLQTEVNLPVLSLQERQKARSQLQGIRQEREFNELVFPRNRKLFGSGFLDYQFTGSSFNRLDNQSQTLNTTYGFELLGGDMSGKLNLNRTTNGDIRAVTDVSNWRYVISDNPYLTTVRAGNVSTQRLSGGRVRGISFSNEPLYRPISFDVYPIFGVTEPGSEVELILNNRLVDFVNVDESGEYELYVPIQYGNTTLEVVKYLPDGRIQRDVKELRIPGSFLSPGEIRYKGTIGLDEQLSGTTFNGVQAQRDGFAASLGVSAGISRRFTTTQTLYYRVNRLDPWPQYSSSLSARLGKSYLLSAAFAPGSMYDFQLGTLSVSKFSFSARYTRFIPQNVDGVNDNQQASGAFSFPVRFFKNPLQFSFSGQYRDIRKGKYELNYRTSFGFGLRALRFRIVYRNIFSPASENVPGRQSNGQSATYTINTNTSSIPLINRIMGRVSLTANLDHDIENGELKNFSMRAYKSFTSRTSFNATFDRDLVWGGNSFQAGLQIRFNKVRSTTNTRILGSNRSVTQTISGSVGYDSHFRMFVLSERNMVGSAAASVVQFVDDNANATYESGEKILDFDGLGFVSGGQRSLGSDGVLRLWQLPAYRQVNMSIDNIRNPNPTAVTQLDQFSIFTDPNRFKLLEIPYNYSGVAIGGIYKMEYGEKTGLGGANFIIRAKDGTFETEERTFSDGGFYVMGIPPGEYVLELNPLLVSFLDIGDQVTQTEFTITPRRSGDFVEGIEILLQP